MVNLKYGSLSRGALLALVGSFSVAPALAQVSGPSGAITQNSSGVGSHIVNLQDVEMSVLIDDVSTITGYTFIVHPSVRGQVTVSSQVPLSTEEVFQVFLSTLRVHGFTAVPGANGVFKIVPEQSATAEAALASNAVTGDQVETAVFRVRSVDAMEVARLVKPVTNAQGQVLASSQSNSVIIVDYATNIARVRQIIDRLDQDRSSIVTIKLSNMSAAEMATTVNALNAGQSNAFQYDVGAVALDTGNTLVLRGAQEDVDRVAQIVERLDRENELSQESLAVRQLQFAQASDIAPILQSMGGRMVRSMSVGGADVQEPAIEVHEPTNSIILNAEPQVLRQLNKIIDDLDVRRAQVLVEAIVVELSDTATRELGLQFIVGGGEDDTVPFVSTNFSRSTPNILSLAGALMVDGDSDGGSALRDLAINSLLSTNGALLGFGGQNSDGTVFGAIVNAVDQDTDSSILSTPSVLALDNETASFLSGQEIPVTTGETLGTNNSNPFRTVERQDVGVQLDITPQISQGDTIRLNIRQEVSSVDETIVYSSASFDFITNKRELETTILADDGDIIVLGGLIQEEESVSVSKVPLLGDIPILGRAFRYDNVNATRRNLMVFLRPTIVRDSSQMRDATQRKSNFMIEAQRNATPDGFSSLEELLRELEEGVR
ncbi:MAG: type II secretion system secretin GspD [Hyphomonadaceae bacterium]|nr:type II secretion system secretin GspD [Hyphomonadaceae bacterium]